MIDDQYFNPRAPYGARHAFDRAVSRQDFISIHAPHTGRDTPLRWMIFFVEIFQSTRPIRGATPTGRLFLCQKTNFNPRAPYGARLCFCFALVIRLIFQSTRPIRSATRDSLHPSPRGPISIHAPHTGRDAGCSRWDLFTIAFQSTRPIRGATLSTGRSQSLKLNFNPRAPYGARR